MNDTPLAAPPADTLYREADQTSHPRADHGLPPSTVPLLSEVVIPGAALAAAVQAASTDARSLALEDPSCTEGQRLGHSLPEVAESIETSVRETLAQAGQAIVQAVMAQIHPHSAISAHAKATPAPPPPPEGS
ncbi:MAG: hypothetical protein ACFCVA_07680 [Gammaproteobacteria bacterium]